MSHKNFIRLSKSDSLSHMTAMITGLKQIIKTPITSFFIVLIISISLFLAMIFQTISKNIALLEDHWNESAAIYLYLKKNSSAHTATLLLTKLQTEPAFTKVRLITPTEGIKIFKDNSLLKSLLINLKTNPLPQLIVIYPSLKSLTTDKLTAIVEKLNSYPEVDLIKMDQTWINNSYNILKLWGDLSIILTWVFLLNILIIAGGTSYIMTRVFVINNNYSNLPLAYQCASYTFFGALLALLLIKITTILSQTWGSVLAEPTYSQYLLLGLLVGFLSFIISKATISLFKIT